MPAFRSSRMKISRTGTCSLLGTLPVPTTMSASSRPSGTFQEPAQPSAAIASATANQKKEANLAIASWQKSECVALRCIMMTTGKLHHEAILKHQNSGATIYRLYTKICDYHQQCDASQ